MRAAASPMRGPGRTSASQASGAKLQTWPACTARSASQPGRRASVACSRAVVMTRSGCRRSSTSFNISLFDSNGNQLPSDSDLRTVWALNNYSRNHLGPSPATEVLISATGGNVVSGKFNSTNTGLYAQAKIQVKDLIGGKVELHTWNSSKVLASVSIDQNSSDIVRFDLSGMGSKDLQSLLSSSPRFTFWVYDKNGLITQTESMQFQAIAAGISHADVSANANANVENLILEKLNPVTAAYTVGGTENVNEIGNSGFTVNSYAVTVIGISGLSVDIT